MDTRSKALLSTNTNRVSGYQTWPSWGRVHSCGIRWSQHRPADCWTYRVFFMHWGKCFYSAFCVISDMGLPGANKSFYTIAGFNYVLIVSDKHLRLQWNLGPWCEYSNIHIVGRSNLALLSVCLNDFRKNSRRVVRKNFWQPLPFRSNSDFVTIISYGNVIETVI